MSYFVQIEGQIVFYIHSKCIEIAYASDRPSYYLPLCELLKNLWSIQHAIQGFGRGKIMQLLELNMKEELNILAYGREMKILHRLQTLLYVSKL